MCYLCITDKGIMLVSAEQVVRCPKCGATYIIDEGDELECNCYEHDDDGNYMDYVILPAHMEG